MSSAIPQLSSGSVAQTYDPFAVLSDLEISLVLSFLTIEETIVIRRVSTLWKACVDFRLSKGAISRHFPGTAEAEAVYSSWEGEALAFRRLAFFSGTLATPSVARKFEGSLAASRPRCTCDHHMVWGCDTHINIQRLWDPGNPTRENFPVMRKDLNIYVEGRPWNHKYLGLRWLAGDDKNGTIILYLGVPGRIEKPTYPRWLVAVSVTTRKVLWHYKHGAWIREPHRLGGGYLPCTPVSFGHGKICFVESGYSAFDHAKLVIINAVTGNLEACEPMPDDHHMISSNGGNHLGIRFAAHPTKEVYFLVMAQELWVFSTKTAKLLVRHTVPSIERLTSNCYFRFGRNIDEAGEQTWLLCKSNNSIVGHDIELENFQIGRGKVWSLKGSDSCIEKMPQVWRAESWTETLIDLDPIRNFAYTFFYIPHHLRIPVRVVVMRFESMPSTSERTLETPDYRIKSYEFVTLPPKKIGAKKERNHKASWNSIGVADENELSNGRRHFMLSDEVLGRNIWADSPYLVIDDHLGDPSFYVFGCVPRW